MAKNEEYLYAQTPSFMGVDDPKKFLGQSSPGIAKAHSKNDFYDKNLFDALLEKWCEYFIKKKQRDWSLIALFRSLEMAYRASAMPFGNQGSLHDYGANISLWVSAFEILVHPKSSWVPPPTPPDIRVAYPAVRLVKTENDKTIACRALFKQDATGISATAAICR